MSIGVTTRDQKAGGINKRKILIHFVAVSVVAVLVLVCFLRDVRCVSKVPFVFIVLKRNGQGDTAHVVRENRCAKK